MLEVMDYIPDKRERALMKLHQNFPDVIHEILEDFKEKGYSFLSKKALRRRIKPLNRYQKLLCNVKIVIKVEQTATSIIIYPREVYYGPEQRVY